MKKHDAQGPNPLRKRRLQSLLFTSAALGTTLVTLESYAGPKLSPFVGE